MYVSLPLCRYFLSRDGSLHHDLPACNTALLRATRHACVVSVSMCRVLLCSMARHGLSDSGTQVAFTSKFLFPLLRRRIVPPRDECGD